jgi:hypothetical protein
MSPLLHCPAAAAPLAPLPRYSRSAFAFFEASVPPGPRGRAS